MSWALSGCLSAVGAAGTPKGFWKGPGGHLAQFDFTVKWHTRRFFVDKWADDDHFSSNSGWIWISMRIEDYVAVEIAINGSHYKAVPELTSIEELDSLTRFFLDEVLPVESRIEQLLHVFGLPKRLVEDILADLLKQNLISLRLDSGRVELQTQQPLRRQRKAGVTIEVWQDETTGALLPFRMIAALGKPVPGALEIALTADDEIL